MKVRWKEWRSILQFFYPEKNKIYCQIQAEHLNIPMWILITAHIFSWCQQLIIWGHYYFVLAFFYASYSKQQDRAEQTTIRQQSQNKKLPTNADHTNTQHTHTEMNFLYKTMRDNWTTHHHVIGFWDVYFKLKSSTLVVTLIWKQIEDRRQEFSVMHT